MKSRFNEIWRKLLGTLIVSFIFPTVVLHKQVSGDVQLSDMPSHVDGNIERIDPRTNPRPVTTLVHYDPYFMGGFRNQHMRFVAFVDFAVKNKIQQILLPSLRWSDHYNKPNSIHHELLFDVPFWNSRAESLGLPLLVNYDPTVLEGIVSSSNDSDKSRNQSSADVIPCFNVSSSLYSGLDELLLRSPNVKIRQVNTWDMIGQGETYSHCRRYPHKVGDTKPDDSGPAARFTFLVAYGGLRSSGRLWWDYLALQQSRRAATETAVIDGQVVQIYPEHGKVEQAILEILRPSQPLRSAVENTIHITIQNATKQQTSNRPRILALHPRVEREMMSHSCAKHIVKDLGVVFDRLRLFEHRFSQDIGLVFIAVSKAQVVGPNKVVLDYARIHGLFGDNVENENSSRPGIPIFELGTDAAAKVQFRRVQPSLNNTSEGSPLDTAESLGVPELVASVINFFTAVNAEIFVGVEGSTYSADAFSIRWYRHKKEGGAESYMSGPDGIHRMYGPSLRDEC